MVNLILASQSPRRRQLLTDAGYSFIVFPPNNDEPRPGKNQRPEEYIRCCATVKGENVLARVRALAHEDVRDRQVIVACDTVALLNGEILGKPISRSDAFRMLRLLSDSYHDVLSGLYLCSVDGKQKAFALVKTTLVMKELSVPQIQAYLDTGLWEGKAGAFGYQDGNDWVKIVEGSESNVVGLPMEQLEVMLRDF